jgi:hypothetical protein
MPKKTTPLFLLCFDISGLILGNSHCPAEFPLERKMRADPDIVQRISEYFRLDYQKEMVSGLATFPEIPDTLRNV